jgi:hypothetical protein
MLVMIIGGEVVASLDILGVSSSITVLVNDSVIVVVVAAIIQVADSIALATVFTSSLGRGWTATGFPDSESTSSVDDCCLFHVGRCFEQRFFIDPVQSLSSVLEVFSEDLLNSEKARSTKRSVCHATTWECVKQDSSVTEFPKSQSLAASTVTTSPGESSISTDSVKSRTSNQLLEQGTGGQAACVLL